MVHITPHTSRINKMMAFSAYSVVNAICLFLGFLAVVAMLINRALCYHRELTTRPFSMEQSKMAISCTTCSIVIFFFLGFFAVVALLINRGYSYHLQTTTRPFAMAACRVQNVNKSGALQTCEMCYEYVTEECPYDRHNDTDCGQRTRTKCHPVYYPCLQVTVTFDLGEGHEGLALLHYDEDHLNEDQQCSYHACELDGNYSRKIVNNYAAKFTTLSTTNKTFPCYINMADRSQAVEIHLVKEYQAMHVYIWSSLTLTVSVITMTYLLCRRARKKRQETPVTNAVNTNSEAVPLQMNQSTANYPSQATPSSQPALGPYTHPHGAHMNLYPQYAFHPGHNAYYDPHTAGADVAHMGVYPTGPHYSMSSGPPAMQQVVPLCNTATAPPVQYTQPPPAIPSAPPPYSEFPQTYASHHESKPTVN